MNSRAVFFLAIAAVGVALAAASKAPRSPQRLTVDESRALLGVYQGAGCDGAKRLEKFKSWFGGEPDHMLDFAAWNMMTTSSVWQPKCWADAKQKIVVYSLPMLPEDRSGTLAQGAAGTYDSQFRNYAIILVKYGYGNSIIRLGWEFNGGWYAWQAAKDNQSFIAYWRRIVNVMRAVPGSNFKFDWNPSQGGNDPVPAYPGDDYVDIIGLDFYNVSWDPKIVTPEQRWKELFNSPYGLKWHHDFAQQHGKPMSFPEWGTGMRTDGHGGGDDPYFVQQMAHWIATNEVVYHDYWDYAAGDFNGALSDGHQPKSSAEFLRLFGPGKKYQ